MIDLDYYRTVVETQHSVEILKAELLDLIEECEGLDWIRVEDKLPLQNTEPGVCDQYIVTVELKDPDPNDDSEVMFLWFNNRTNVFSLRPSYEEEHDWHVVAWAECPEPWQKQRITNKKEENYGL